MFESEALQMVPADKNPQWDLDLSIIIPVKDEVENIASLAEELEAAIASVSYSWECIWVDDGSTDSTIEQLKALNQRCPRHQYIVLSRNYGQAAALYTGFCNARGCLFATIDGDGQNDPEDLPVLVNRLVQDGLDVVQGVRQERKDTFIRRASSRIANAFRNCVTGENIADVGCSLRVFRHACVRHVSAFKGMHRFLPTLIRNQGYSKIVEMPVCHRPRKYGKTKYGIHNRLWVGLMDTLAVRWMQTRMVHAKVESTSFSNFTSPNEENEQ
jgi:glycosyltransferase involved in cell wall biosynthesis